MEKMVRIGSLFTDNHGNKYLIDEGWFSKNIMIITKKVMLMQKYLDILGTQLKKKYLHQKILKKNEWYYYDLKNSKLF